MRKQQITSRFTTVNSSFKVTLSGNPDSATVVRLIRTTLLANEARRQFYHTTILKNHEQNVLMYVRKILKKKFKTLIKTRTPKINKGFFITPKPERKILFVL